MQKNSSILPGFLREAIKNAIPQVVDLLKDSDLRVSETVATTLGELAQFGSHILVLGLYIVHICP
jgi:hypothetical protein